MAFLGSHTHQKLEKTGNAWAVVYQGPSKARISAALTQAVAPKGLPPIAWHHTSDAVLSAPKT